MERVGVVLWSQVFAHGQLYVALSRVKDVDKLLVVQLGNAPGLINVVKRYIFMYVA